MKIPGFEPQSQHRPNNFDILSTELGLLNIGILLLILLENVSTFYLMLV